MTTLRAILLLHLALLLLYGLLSPVLQAPDEPAHADMALSVLDLSGYPQPGERELNRRVVNSRNLSGYDKRATDRVAADAPPRPRPPLDQVGRDRPTEGALNIASQHPPVYYVLAGTFLGVVSSLLSLVVTPAHDQVFLLLRLFNILLLLPLPWFAHLAARRLGGSISAANLAAAAVVAIPQLHYIGASVNNDNAVVIAFGALTYLLSRVATGDHSWRTAGVIGLVSAAASLSKVFGLASLPWIGFVYLGGMVRAETRRRAMASGLLALGVAGVVGGSWYLRNLIVFGKLQPLINDRSPGPDFVRSFEEWVTGYPSRMVQSFWGNFGYLDVPVPWWLVVVATTAAVLAVAVGTWRGTRPLWHRMVLLAPILLVLGGNAVQHWTTIYPRAGGFAGAQGRYLFALVPPAAVLIGVGVRRRRVGRWLLLALLVGTVVLHVAAVVALLNGYWGFESGPSHALRNVLAWSPLARPMTLAVLLGAPLAALLAACAVWRDPLGPGPGGDDAGGTPRRAEAG